jgi:hypothetical protein
VIPVLTASLPEHLQGMYQEHMWNKEYDSIACGCRTLYFELKVFGGLKVLMVVKLLMLIFRTDDEESMYTACNKNQAFDESLNKNDSKQ